MLVGIDNIRFYTPNFYLDLNTLAQANGMDPNKYYQGIWQEQMSIAPPDEDVVTMAANAAAPLVEQIDKNTITDVLFATETGVDQSKAAGVYVHGLLSLSANCRVVELKQACYSSTAAVQMACAMVARQPEKKVLVIASDIARYDLNTPGEATQGSGAVAMIICANPSVFSISPYVGNHTEDVMDFWRPNYRSNAIVDGKYSAKVYLSSLKSAWQQFSQVSGLSFEQFKHVCYHLPFSRMAEKAQMYLAKVNKVNLSEAQCLQKLKETIHYNRTIGNTYTASLYIGLLSLLENSKCDLSGEQVGLFAYGSGCVAEFFSGTVQPGYQKVLNKNEHYHMLLKRKEIDYQTYLSFYQYFNPVDGGNHFTEQLTTGRFRLSGISQHKRIYQPCSV